MSTKLRYGIGKYTVGKYKALDELNHQTPAYACWSSMLKRCCHKYTAHYMYDECTICDEWLDFQTFAEWYHKNYYSINGEKMFLDKDLLVPNNLIYSPETCVFVNRKLNNFLTLRSRDRGTMPLGVRYFPNNTNQYQAYISDNGKIKILGSFQTVEQAFNVYCSAKNQQARSFAEEYKNQVPKVLYTALLTFDIKKYIEKLK